MLFRSHERPIVQQIFGSNPEVMAKAANIIYEKFKPDAIDINMGCPVYNLVSNFNGAALIKEPERASAIVRAVKKSVPCSVSVKTRTGWKNDRDCLDFVKVLADAGVDLISIHGRTREQGYAGTSDWNRIAEARAMVPHTPFLLNGDVTSPELAKQALEISNADGVLIGRGALGRPWIFKHIEHYLETGERLPHPTLEQRIAIVKEHGRLQVEHYGEKGLIKLRKHLPWYFKKNPTTYSVSTNKRTQPMHESKARQQTQSTTYKALRSDLVRISTLKELYTILDEIQTRYS